MTARHLLSELRGLGVTLALDGECLLVDAPVGVVTGELRDTLVENKRALLELLATEGVEREGADRRGLAIRWSDEPGWIALHDPTTGEWHKVMASDCLPSVVRAAEESRRSNAGARRREGATPTAEPRRASFFEGEGHSQTRWRRQK